MTTRELVIWFAVSCLTAQAISGFILYFVIMRRLRNSTSDSKVLATLVAKISETHDGVAKASDALENVGKQLGQLYHICPLGRGNANQPEDCG